MKISILNADSFVVEVSRQELLILAGSIDEAVEDLGDEYRMRVGATEVEALALSEQMIAALKNSRDR